MTGFVTASFTVLVITAALLFWIAFSDLREYRIRNEFVIILAALYFVYAALSGRWITLHWNIGFAALMFAVMLFFYLRNMMGGGDLKLMTVAFLWTGYDCAVPFLLILIVFASLHAMAASWGWVESRKEKGKARVAFAPTVSAGLIGIFLLGCLHPI